MDDKEKKNIDLVEIDKIFNAASGIAKNAGLNKNQRILKAAELTLEQTGIDVFDLLKIERPICDSDRANEFYAALDLLLENGWIKNYCLDESEIHVPMKHVMEKAKEKLGLTIKRQDFNSIKSHSRFIQTEKTVNNRLSGNKSIKCWAYLKKINL